MKLHHPKLKGKILPGEARDGDVVAEIAPDPDIESGAYELSLVTPGGESARVRVHVDDLPQILEADSTRTWIR